MKTKINNEKINNEKSNKDKPNNNKSNKEKINIARIKNAFLTALKMLWQDIWHFKFLIIGFAIYCRLAKLLLGAMCPMVIATGLPCPGCGMTRAAISVLTLDFHSAFVYNPNIFLWGVYLLYLGICRYIFLKKKIPFFNTVSIIVLSVTIGVYIYRMMYCFPGEKPMTYMYKNAFSMMLPGYKNFVARHWSIYTK